MLEARTATKSKPKRPGRPKSPAQKLPLIGVRVPPEMREKLKRISEDQKRPVKDLVIEKLNDMVEKFDDHYRRRPSDVQGRRIYSSVNYAAHQDRN